MRPTIRWQKRVEEWLTRTRDVECLSLEFDASLNQGLAQLRMTGEDELPEEYLAAGSLVELLDGQRVIAVGVVEV